MNNQVAKNLIRYASSDDYVKFREELMPVLKSKYADNVAIVKSYVLKQMNNGNPTGIE